MWEVPSSRRQLKPIKGPLSWSRMPRRMQRYQVSPGWHRCQVPGNPHGAEEVTGPQSGLRSSKGLCVLWFVYSWGRRVPMFSHTHIFGSPVQVRLPWSGESPEQLRKRSAPASQNQEEHLSHQLSLHGARYWQSLTLCSQSKARCWKAVTKIWRARSVRVNWGWVNNWHGWVGRVEAWKVCSYFAYRYMSLVTFFVRLKYCSYEGASGRKNLSVHLDLAWSLLDLSNFIVRYNCKYLFQVWNMILIYLNRALNFP